MTDLDHASYGTNNLNVLMGRPDPTTLWHEKLKQFDGSTRSNILDGLQINCFSISLSLLLLYQKSPKFN